MAHIALPMGIFYLIKGHVLQCRTCPFAMCWMPRRYALYGEGCHMQARVCCSPCLAIVETFANFAGKTTSREAKKTIKKAEEYEENQSCRSGVRQHRALHA